MITRLYPVRIVSPVTHRWAVDSLTGGSFRPPPINLYSLQGTDLRKDLGFLLLKTATISLVNISSIRIDVLSEEVYIVLKSVRRWPRKDTVPNLGLSERERKQSQNRGGGVEFSFWQISSFCPIFCLAFHTQETSVTWELENTYPSRGPALPERAQPLTKCAIGPFVILTSLPDNSPLSCRLWKKSYVKLAHTANNQQ